MATAVFTQIYEYKGRKYEVMGIAKFKHPITRQWAASVIYRPQGVVGENYVREAGEFHERFKFVESKQLRPPEDTL